MLRSIYDIEGVLRKMDEAYEMHLLVERDFEEKEYVSSEDGTIVLHPFDPLRYKEVPNIIEHMIEKVLKRKSGKVDIVSRDF